MPQTTDSFDELWELAEFSVREARVLRSLLEYLRISPDTPENRGKLENWHREVGLQLGNPVVTDSADLAFQRVRDAPLEVQKIVLRQVLANAHAAYFPKP